MTDITYAIVFAGEIIDGAQVISVKAHLAKMLKADPAKMKILFSGKPVVLKRTQDKAQAIKYGNALKKAGAKIRIKVLKNKTISPNNLTKIKPIKTSPPLADTPQTTTEITLRPNQGNLFEPRPDTPSPTLDLSEYSVKENDGTNLVTARVFERADMDLSHLSADINDGSPLIEPSPAIEKLASPDFGLDSPGAILPTLKPEVTLLNPDTSNISLANSGVDLLPEDEKPPTAKPLVPDISQLSLRANAEI
ncbi:MAG: hypothetical protein KUG79_07875 [Pseudomonadales bacterium]|nr:hypothetical protein [Pseudomonadales bacterium]